jgi:hypothetical protein
MNGLRKRTTAACPEAGVKAVTCSKAGDEAAMCSKARDEAATPTVGSGVMTVSRVTEKRESARSQKITKCGEREHGA